MPARLYFGTFELLFYRFGMAAGVHFGTFGLTFEVLGEPWEEHLGTLGTRAQKTAKKSLFWTLLLEHI